MSVSVFIADKSMRTPHKQHLSASIGPRSALIKIKIQFNFLLQYKCVQNKQENNKQANKEAALC